MKQNKVTLDSLIKEAQDIALNLTPRSGHPYGGYYLHDNLQYETWKNLALRFLSANFPGDRCIKDFEYHTSLFELDNREKCHLESLIALLNSCHAIPILPKLNTENDIKTMDKTININVSQNQSQTQSQEQKQVIEIFLESIKDEITGKQFKELKEIAKEEPNPEKAKTRILDKIKSWSGDVLANVVANIVTNPTVWSGLLG